MFGLPLRTGYSMKVNGIHLNRHDMHNIAAELGVSTNDVPIKDGVLTVYNTSKDSIRYLELKFRLWYTIRLPVNGVVQHAVEIAA